MSIKIPPYHYIHVLDTVTNITRLEVGPQTYIKQDQEKIVTGDKPLKHVILPPRHYIEIGDPVVRDGDGKPVFDKYGQAVVRHGEVEIRFSDDYPEPFPLYPRETKGSLTKLVFVKENEALRITAVRNFKNKAGKDVVAGDEWLFEGPATYYPRIEERIVDTVKAVIIGKGQALRLRAREQTTDVNGVTRANGEEWLIRTPGAYLPRIYETVVELQNPVILNTRTALHLRATKKFEDVYGKLRNPGDEWLVTHDMSTHHIYDVYEEYIDIVELTTLTKSQYAYVVDPVDPKTGKNRLGAKELRKGETAFFLQPGEYLDGGIRDVYILGDDNSLLLKANEKYIGEDGATHEPGDKWMVKGPTSYIPPIQVEVVEKRNKIPLDKNEGVYVRDTKTGLVRSEIGKTFMLAAHEELSEMELSETVEKIIAEQSTSGTKRDKTRVVSYRIPFNTAVQVYDYKKKESRVVFGPGLVQLAPDEQFTVCVLSGSKPKRPGVVETIAIQMGPEFSTDIIIVETSDHARLKLQLSYNWYFDVDRNNQEQAQSIFNVRDFIGDMCNLMASKVRGAVAGVPFEDFHKNSARLIRKSIFGTDDKGKIKDDFRFPKNNLVVTNVDIQNVEPVDEKTKLSLQKSVTLAIEISTSSLEQNAKYQADKFEQQAKGQLLKLKIEADSRAEEAKQKLLQVQAECQSIKNQGQAKAEARARAKAEEIECKLL